MWDYFGDDLMGNPLVALVVLVLLIVGAILLVSRLMSDTWSKRSRRRELHAVGEAMMGKPADAAEKLATDTHAGFLVLSNDGIPPADLVSPVPASHFCVDVVDGSVVRLEFSGTVFHFTLP